ncbi:8523_t:CDS:2, partial [Entrophospora sp. SA101]
MIAVIETENQALRWLNKAKRNEFLVFENNYDTFTKEKIIENSPDIVLKKVYSNKIHRRFSLLNLKLNDLYTIKEFLQDHQRIQNHENIINFYGIFEAFTTINDLINMIAVIETENQALRWLNKAKRNEFLVFENNYDTFTKEKIIENSPDI